MRSALKNAKQIASGRASLEMSYGAIALVCFMAFAYMVISSIGIDTYKKCDKKPKETMYAFLTHTLTIALTIPFTLFLGRMFKSDVGLWMSFFGLMGLVGASITVHISNKCKNSKKSNREFSYFALPMFILSCLIGMYLVRKNSKSMTRQLAMSKGTALNTSKWHKNEW